MATTFTPTLTNDGSDVIAKQVLTRGSTVRGTLDLRANFGAELFIKLGRGGTAALTTALTVRISRVPANGALQVGVPHPSMGMSRTSQTAAAASTTVNVDSSAGSATLNVASITNFAAGDIICIQDSGGGTTRLEWQRVSKTATGVLTLDEGLTFAHTAAQADTVRNKADVFEPLWLPGLSLWEVIADYGADTTGDSITLQVIAQTYASESGA
jgi:hypothetical protein